MSLILSAPPAYSLIRPFAQHLPDMRAVFSIHDQPQIYLSATRRASLIELGLRGERELLQNQGSECYTEPSDYVDTSHLNESHSSEIRWDRSCRRESNLRNPNKHEVDRTFEWESL
jgi:beta-1,2-xylosyltransferase